MDDSSIRGCHPSMTSMDKDDGHGRSKNCWVASSSLILERGGFRWSNQPFVNPKRVEFLEFPETISDFLRALRSFWELIEGFGSSWDL